MSVLVVAKVRGDTAAFQKALTDRAHEFAAISTRAREMGAIHHRFGIGDGFVLVADEWETADGFQQFFGDPKMQEFIGTVGAGPGPPEITFSESSRHFHHHQFCLWRNFSIQFHRRFAGYWPRASCRLLPPSTLPVCQLPFRVANS